MFQKRHFLSLAAAGALLAAPIAFAGHHEKAKPSDHSKSSYEKKETIAAIVSGNEDFSTLLSLVKSAGLADALAGDTKLTVFAPTNAAFEKVPADVLEKLGADKEALAAVLKYHIVPGKYPAEKVLGNDSLKTLAGPAITISSGDYGAKVNNAKITKTDIKASNGVIHVIDSVLMPPKQKDIVGTAVEAGTFNTLAKLLQDTGLDKTLSGEGPYTVFAPTDQAFAKVPEGVLQSLADNPDRLKAVLLYHVVPGNVTSAEVVKLDSAKTAQGAMVDIDVADGKVMVNQARVVATDIQASNGVIHVIDSVILPPA